MIHPSLVQEILLTIESSYSIECEFWAITWTYLLAEHGGVCWKLEYYKNFSAG